MLKSSQGNLRTAFIFFMIAFLILFGTASFLANNGAKSDDSVTGNTININKDNTVKVPDSDQSLPNVQEGTISLWTKPPVQIFDEFSDEKEYLVFFSAMNMPGLRIVYNLKEKRFESGSPLLRSPPIDIFDGQNHQLVYTFRKGGQQMILLDGVKVDESEFRPIEITKVTGFAIAPMIPETSISGVELAMYDRQVTADMLDKI